MIFVQFVNISVLSCERVINSMALLMPRKLIVLKEFLLLFWTQGILKLQTVLFNWSILHVVPTFFFVFMFDRNIFKLWHESAHDAHIGAMKVNISYHFILVMPRPFENMYSLTAVCHEKGIYVVRRSLRQINAHYCCACFCMWYVVTRVCDLASSRSRSCEFVLV